MTSIIANCTLNCNLECVHCYCSASPKNKNTLSLKDFEQIIQDVKNMGIESPPFFDITGGEFLLIDESALMSKMVRSNFPLTTIILESNGLLLLKDFEKYESIEFDRLHISVDAFHSNLNKGEKIIKMAMKLCENKGAKLVINHIPDDSRLSNEDCIKKARKVFK